MIRARFSPAIFSLCAFLVVLSTSCWGKELEPILLWPNGAPGAVGEEPADKPHIRVYLTEAKQNTGAAVVICPGGGYGILATDHEGVQLARWFNRKGVNAAVVKYRHGSRYRHPAPLQDVQRALRHVRAHASEWQIDPKRVGVMGFSAGGHLASTAATQFDAGNANAKDPIDKQSCRPDFAILGYPVISMSEPFGHAGSRRNLLGDKASDPEWANKLSNEKQVTAETPPTFLFHTGEDKGVPAENSLAFYAALRKAGVPAELHVYRFGPHGVGMAAGDPAVSSWTNRLYGWMRTSGFLSNVKRVAVQGSVTLDGKPLRWGSIAFVPEDATQPVAWSMVSRGRYRVPEERGVVAGKTRVVIRNLGAVQPEPTIEDVTIISPDGLSAQPVDGKNVFDYKLTSQ